MSKEAKASDIGNRVHGGIFAKLCSYVVEQRRGVDQLSIGVV